MAIVTFLKRLSLLILGPLLVAAISAWFYLNGGRYVTTENAYLKSEIITVSSEMTGKVKAVIPRENDRVKRGDLVISLYEEPSLIAISQAEATLANVQAELLSLQAEYASRLLEIESARTEFEYRQVELERLRQLLAENSVSIAQFDQAKFAFQEAENDLELKRQDLQISRARLIDPDKPVEQHPRYLQASAELNRAKLNHSYYTVIAPAEGIATNISAHVGENIIAGTNLFNIVNDREIWIEANFKETDLTHVRTGQPVTVTIDTYPEVEWRGTVRSITPATGSEFSLLPAQNSSGNWVKVVQRINVRIELDADAHAYPLMAGMSAEVAIDTGHERDLDWLRDYWPW